MTNIINNDIDYLIIQALDPISALAVGRTNRTLRALVDKHLKLTTSLDLSRPSVEKTKNTEEQYSALFSGERFKNLTNLSLRNRHHLNNEKLNIVTQRCKKLQRINLSCCRSIDDRAIHLLLENCKELQFLSLGCTRVTNEGVTLLKEGYPNLKQLNLSGCSKVRFPFRPTLNGYTCIITPATTVNKKREWSTRLEPMIPEG
jgi:hypothetical protein